MVSRGWTLAEECELGSEDVLVEIDNEDGGQPIRTGPDGIVDLVEKLLTVADIGVWMIVSTGEDEEAVMLLRPREMSSRTRRKPLSTFSTRPSPAVNNQ